MRKAPPQALLPLLALLAASAIAGCGGGSTSPAPSTSAQGAPTTTTGTAPAAKPPGSKTTAKPAGPKPGPAPSPGSRGPASGGAKSFVEPHADNSIPNFGAESGASQRTQAGTALRAYLTARARGDWTAACSGLAASVRRQLQAFAAASKGKLKGCAPLYRALSGGGPAAARANPLSGPLAALRVKGKSAFALFYGPHNQKFTMPMVREGSAWKVGQLAPMAYPIGAAATSR